MQKPAFDSVGMRQWAQSVSSDVLRVVLERGGFIDGGEDWRSIAERYCIVFSRVPKSPLWQAFCEQWPMDENYTAFADLSAEDAVLRSAFVIVYMERDAGDTIPETLRPRFSVDCAQL